MDCSYVLDYLYPDLSNLVYEYWTSDDLFLTYKENALPILEVRAESIKVDGIAARILLKRPYPELIYQVLPDYVKVLLLLYSTKYEQFSAYIKHEYNTYPGVIYDLIARMDCKRNNFNDVHLDWLLKYAVATPHCQDIIRLIRSRFTVNTVLLGIAVREGIKVPSFEVLAKDTDLNTLNGIMVSVLYHNQDCLESLIRLGADVNTYGRYTSTPIDIALSRFHDIPLALRLIGLGADINRKCPDGLTPLMRAACDKNKDVTPLLDMKADPNVQDCNGKTALFLAVTSGNENVVQVLLRANANPHIKDLSGRIALDYASEDMRRFLV